MRTYDEEGIKCNVPGSRFEKWENNRHGFRGPDITVEKQKGIKRIICMGTSETYGLYESSDNEWPAILRQLLDNIKNIEVINTAVVGLPLRKFRRYLEKYVLKFDPDIVILLASPHAYVADRLQKKRDGIEEARTGLPPATPWKDVGFELRITPKLKEAIKSFLPNNIVKKIQFQREAKRVAIEERRWLKGEKPMDSVPPEYINAYRQELARLVAFLSENGIHVILSSYPVLLNEEPFRWMKKDNYERKLKRYENQLRKIKEEKKSA